MTCIRAYSDYVREAKRRGLRWASFADEPSCPPHVYEEDEQARDLAQRASASESAAQAEQSLGTDTQRNERERDWPEAQVAERENERAAQERLESESEAAMLAVEETPAKGGAHVNQHARSPTPATAAEQLAALYERLMAFRSEPKFHEIGFDLCCKYNAWLKRVETLRDTVPPGTWLELGVLPGDLLTLGLEYAQSKGAETGFTRDTTRAFDATLLRQPAKSRFRGKMSATDRCCRDLAIYQRHMDLLLAQNYGVAAEVVSHDDTCPRIHKGTPMRGPLDTQKQGDITYVLVEAQGIGQVWVMEDWVEWRKP